MPSEGGLPAREIKRRQTRERLLGAAISEFRRKGMVEAEVGEIVSAAGVAHGTFFFHFPTKEHVLVELERREEERMADELSRFFRTSPDLPAALTEIVRVITGLEQRLGSRLFKDFLALHFSTTRPPQEEWRGHPVIVAVVGEFERARERGEIPAANEVFYSGVFFLLGLYALLITIPEERSVREEVIENYIATALRGMRNPNTDRT
ncbi:TetR/AcrR family transcriptional regulator [Nocardia bovistercoris]|uniref:TetR/AcrR family transcriptional regulator n=1 Tax=Nocardia bovistercoris TaxID=2785916 RepID=A0A931IAP0_9NOCA|nr:TetR/AcrR family transcriptional regulator [Nocardia bovistercoris]MBH0776970.1 TetR/AcrR family transcriptional regulator [Nocardia bovistercoris]